MVGMPGLEPEITEPETVVLPITPHARDWSENGYHRLEGG